MRVLQPRSGGGRETWRGAWGVGEQGQHGVLVVAVLAGDQGMLQGHARRSRVGPLGRLGHPFMRVAVRFGRGALEPVGDVLLDHDFEQGAVQPGKQGAIVKSR